jgi:hypothetical protein
VILRYDEVAHRKDILGTRRHNIPPREKISSTTFFHSLTDEIGCVFS